MDHVALSLAVFLGGLVSGFSGFAFSAAAGAILLHVLQPIEAIPLMMICSIATQATSMVMVRKFIVWADLLPLLSGGLVGLPIALFLLTVMEPTAFRVAFGIFLASYALLMCHRPGTIAAPGSGGGAPAANSIVGFGSGLVGGLTAMPGALPVIWCQWRSVPKERQRAMVQPFTLLMQIFAVAMLSLSPGMINRELIVNIGFAIPALIVGTHAGMALFGRVDDRKFRLAILVLLFVSGCLMLR
ncbi:MAG: sulfite exporter TauE/SafE family protein [Xanthobacteraceae bacterium]|nr:sulfite exporter TauE/SafE family protein [Xanthobacteraceae bacterium]